MTQRFLSPKALFYKGVGIQWLLGNALAHGVGVSLPIFWADLVADLASAEDYSVYAVSAFATFGIWVGGAQWLILRQVWPLSGEWIFYASLAPLLSAVLPVGLIPVSPLATLLILVTYPLGLSVSQWGLLRRILQPSWSWVFNSFIAIALSLIIGLLSGMLSHLFLRPQISISVLGSLSYGLIYGLVTNIGLRHLTKQNYTPQSSKQDTGLDVPPDTQSWKVNMFTGLMLIAIWSGWIQIALPKASETVIAQWKSIPFVFVVACVFAFGYAYLSIFIHEMGHLLLALTHGFELKACAVDRWVWVRRGRGWKISKTKKRYAGGFVLPIPKSLKVSKRSLMTMIWGGPIASFLLFAISASPLLAPSLVNNHLILWAIALFAGLNLFSFIFNILPLAFGYIRTDGRRILDLAQNNLHGQRFFAIYAYNASLKQGIRPRETNLDLIKQGLAIPEKSSDHVSGLLMAYAVALDKGEIEQAGRYLDEALESHLYLPEIFRGELLLEGTYFEAHLRNRETFARQWFEKIKERALIEPASLCTAEAALHLAEGDQEAARALVDKGLAILEGDHSTKGMAVVQEERLREISGDCRNA